VPLPLVAREGKNPNHATDVKRLQRRSRGRVPELDGVVVRRRRQPFLARQQPCTDSSD
jgi:hypothetical protein